MSENLDLNDAIDAYSHSMYNHESDLRKLIDVSDTSVDLATLIQDIRGFQKELFSIVIKTASTEGFSPTELHRLVTDYAIDQQPWLNAKGKEGLLRWLGWMCWHEGYLRSEDDRQQIDSWVLSITNQNTKTSNADQPLIDALSWLIDTDPADQAFIIVEVPSSEVIVQFAGSKDDPLLMDLPVQAMTIMQLDRITEFFTKHGAQKSSQDISYVVSVGTEICRAAQLTKQIIFNVLQEPESSRLTVSCHTANGLISGR